MDTTQLWLQFKEIFIDLVKYGFPTIALWLSIVSYKDSREANKVQERLNLVEEKLMQYELEEKEKEREAANKACVEARIMNISRHNYKMKIWNSGKATGYDVDFIIEEACKGMVWRENVPYEFLDSGKSFDEKVFVHMGTPTKFRVTTTWKDKEGTSYYKEQIVTI